jgi:hypothetical protein
MTIQFIGEPNKAILKDSGHTWSYKEDFNKVVRDLEASRKHVKELEAMNITQRIYFDENVELKEKLAEAVEVLEFYGDTNQYDYDTTKDVNYMWNDRGLLANKALLKIKAVKEV